MNPVEIALAVLFIVMCGLIIIETRGYSKYIAAQEALVKAYKDHVVTITTVLTALSALSEEHDRIKVKMHELEADNDILRVMIDTLCTVQGVSLPHLRDQLHKHDS